MSKPAGGLRTLASLVPKLARPVTGKRGLAEAGLVTDWPAIAGAEIAARCQPERLDFPRGERMDGTLHLRVEGAWALAIQHLEPQLVARINASLGYRAVARLRLIQAPATPRPAARPPSAAAAPALPVPVERARLEALARQVAAIEDDGLRQAVERLGRALLAAEDGDKMR